ncbi:hypothetical protein [Streptosporangium sp. OZ121]
MKIDKADLVSMTTTLRAAYGSFAELEAALWTMLVLLVMKCCWRYLCARA